eukprot:313586_1
MTDLSKPLRTKENSREIIGDASELKSFVNSLIFRIDNKYYDLTNFVNEHPGGANILYFAKRKSWDATQLFSIHHVNYMKASSVMNKYLICDEKIISKIHELEQVEIPKYFPKQIPQFSSKYYPFNKEIETAESRYKPYRYDNDDGISNNNELWTFNDLKMADCTFELPQKGSFYWELREKK